MNAPVRISIHQQLLALLNRSHARYRVVEHEAVGKCEAVSKIRGTALGQGAKALVCKVKGHGVNQHVSGYPRRRSSGGFSPAGRIHRRQ
ncbi:YbaK/prolyl-tRNA synthetase-associated domain protein [Klebsiella grimontii]|uniref:YbaK/prolyl-tRNA synthetase-associated domain protein n=1 Tax=Klebsiella grimontii TaxID=2058152 RepID=A0A7H4P5K5_9ENTR|nr:YbaK/prolyl-tRNA synthetase-associated domain protein [Klebsiella grimontii]